MTRLPLAAALALLPLGALAQDGPRLSFSLGAGVSAVPEYFGSDEVEAGPSVALGDVHLSFGPVAFGDPDPTDGNVDGSASSAEHPAASATTSAETAAAVLVPLGRQVAGG